MLKTISRICWLVAMLAAFGLPAKAQLNVFTYQGSLKSGSAPASGAYDFQFFYYAVETGGTALGGEELTNVAVANGIFTVSLAAPSNVFDGSVRYLEIRVRPAGGGAYETLAPRRLLTSAPYAVKSLKADLATTADNAVTAQIADDASALGGIQASGYLTKTEADTSFIKNQTTAQTGDFNVSGTGTANVLNAETQFNLGGSRILSNPGDANLFAGTGAGLSNTEGIGNAFFGSSAGLLNTSGIGNSFFGANSGNSNTTGTGNSFFGQAAGLSNTTGASNSFFGGIAGQSNTTGLRNSFFGTTTGIQNTTGNDNSFFGRGAGGTNTTGSGNTAVGHLSDFLVGNLQNATAIGNRALVGQSNSLVLGSINGVNGATADTTVGIGTTTPNTNSKLHVNGTIRVTNGAVYITNPNTVIITSPNGACWGITVNNSGALSTFPVNPCP
ncbi:MAG: hypothetical protein JSS81_08625 [Acidobacteria bacterium]|nr:hypothetical protein [Acidobacteriota bacterium]